MQVLMVANEALKDEWLIYAPASPVIKWISDIDEQTDNIFDACIDLNFDNSETRLKWLDQLQAPLIIINSVITPLDPGKPNLVRINGWPTFLTRHFVEAACENELTRSKAEKLFSLFGRRTQWVADIPGLITPRVIAAIINEAYFALQEKVSTPEQIDLAMQLGTNYPYGPFEWSRKIGLKNIYRLLNELSKSNPRYMPAELLTRTAIN